MRKVLFKTAFPAYIFVAVKAGKDVRKKSEGGGAVLLGWEQAASG